MNRLRKLANLAKGEAAMALGALGGDPAVGAFVLEDPAPENPAGPPGRCLSLR